MSSGYNLLPDSFSTRGSKLNRLLRPRYTCAFLLVFLLLVGLASLFYWNDPALYASPERAASSSSAEDFDDLFQEEAALPQHNRTAVYPEGQDGRFVRFSNQVWGTGWNDILRERLLNTILAYESMRAPVFSPFEAWAYLPRDDHISPTDRKVLSIPYGAMLSGPTAGSPWGARVRKKDPRLQPILTNTWFWHSQNRL